MNKKTLDGVFYIMVILLVVFMVSTIYLIVHYSEELKSNPLVYGAKRFGNIECTCTQFDTQGNMKSYFGFNSTSMWDLRGQNYALQNFINP